MVYRQQLLLAAAKNENNHVFISYDINIMAEISYPILIGSETLLIYLLCYFGHNKTLTIT